VQALRHDLVDRAVEIWQDHVLDLFVLDSQRDHNNDLMAHNVQVAVEDLAAVQVRNLLIARKADHNVLELVENLEDKQVVALDQEDLDNVLALAVHLEKMLERKRITRVRRHVVKKSTICKPQRWVAQSYLAAMEILLSASVVALHLLTSPRKLAQIPLH
jgi:hypothetical protein